MNILLIGCGNLGKALLKAWSLSEVASKIMVVQPSLSAQNLFQVNDKIYFYKNIQAIPADFIADIVVLAMKPQHLQAFMSESSSYLKDKLIISLLAGVTLKKLALYFEEPQKIIRIMPNIAMKLGQSVNLICLNPNIIASERVLVDQLFNVSGKMIWLVSEDMLDLLTPLSASGPAYFFLLAEVLTQITIQAGVEEKIARELIQQTFLGSALLTSDNHNFDQLTNAVASKGGVTEAALKVLQPLLLETMNKAIIAALDRLKELG